jgi:hydroxyethylthiazole kinase
MIDQIEKTLYDLKKQKPLILSLTNFVTQDIVANCLLSIGAAPIMSACEDELEELLQIASAVYINIGTFDNNFIALVKKATKLANKYHKPIVFDPVGAGTTNIRTQTAQYIAPFPTIIRGNASEIIALGGGAQATKGVEATHTIDDAKEIATRLALKNHTTVIVSGPVDFVTNGNRSAQVGFGSPIMQLVTGMGCAMTAVIAAFQAVIENPFEAGVMAAHYFALCGELAAKNHQYPGTFKTAFLDQIHAPNFKSIKEMYDQRS